MVVTVVEQIVRSLHKRLQNKKVHYTCDKQVLWESAGAFFSARQLVSSRKSHSSGVRGLVVRCLLFNPEVEREPVSMR